MRSAPKQNMPVVLKHTKDKDVPVMYIDDVSKVGADGKGKVSCVWLAKDGTPYKADFNTEMLEKFTPPKDTDSE